MKKCPGKRLSSFPNANWFIYWHTDTQYEQKETFIIISQRGEFEYRYIYVRIFRLWQWLWVATHGYCVFVLDIGCCNGKLGKREGCVAHCLGTRGKVTETID
jgi:hypothetical protein